ncbi:MAG: hypothetical protein ACJA1M_001545, partial [Alphaproteobacteria bacterium]
SIDLSAGYNDNVRTGPSNELEAFFYQVDPGLRVESQFSRHELNLFAGGNFKFYQGESDENINGFYAGADGQIDITDNFKLVAGIGFRESDEQRTSSNAQANGLTDEPIRFKTFDLNLGANAKLNRLSTSINGFRRNIDYQDGNSITNGANIDQDTRDVVVHGITGRTSYDLSPDYKLFVVGELTDRNFDVEANNDRDSTGYRAGVGVEFALTNQLIGEAFGGYMNRKYQNVNNVSDAYFGGNLSWYPTPLLSVYANADRDIQDAFFPGTASKTVSSAGLSAAYEFRRNIIVKPTFNFAFGDYNEIPSGTEETYSYGSDIEYLVNRNLSVVGSYRFTERNTTSALLNDLNYDQNVFMITAKTKL